MNILLFLTLVHNQRPRVRLLLRMKCLMLCFENYFIISGAIVQSCNRREAYHTTNQKAFILPQNKHRMIWQDYVIMAASIIMSVALIPQLYHGFRERKGHITYTTSIPTFIGLYILAFAFMTLQLIFSAITAAVTGTLWVLFFIQRLMYNRKNE